MRKLFEESFSKIDFIVWWFTMLFFLWSAHFYNWNYINSFMWASWIIVLMFIVWFSIELILWALKNVKWLWRITWFITNWPEALVLVVWLISGDVLFAASTPLWSNVMNPLLLLIALIITWAFVKLRNFKYNLFFSLWFIVTWLLAVSFYMLNVKQYIYWLIVTFIISVILYKKQFVHEENIEEYPEQSKWYLPLWIWLLLLSWYFLDPIVSYTSEASNASKWVIWFLVLATLTSWPEFKSVTALLKRWKTLDAFINILVSNLTNLWLAIIWVVFWYFTK